MSARGFDAIDAAGSGDASVMKADVSGVHASVDVSQPPRDPLDAVRAFGPLHVPPIALPHDDARPDAFVAFVGSPDEAISVWVAGGNLSEPQRVQLPAAVRVVGAVPDGDRVHVLLESLRWLDRPAGLTTVQSFALDPRNGASATVDPSLEDARTLAELEHRVATRGASRSSECSPEWPEEQRRVTAEFFVSASGIDLLDWDGDFVRAVRHVARERLNREPIARELLEHAAWSRLPLRAGDAVEEGNRCVLRRHSAPFQTTRPAQRASVPRIVSPESVSDAASVFVRATFGAAAQVIAQAPFGPPGAWVAVARVPVAYGTDELFAVRFEDGHGSASSIGSEGTNSSRIELREVRFADVDGNGRTDLVLAWEFPDGLKREVVLAPDAIAAGGFSRDVAASLVIQSPTSMSDAVSAALGVPTRGVDRATMCGVFASMSSGAAMQRTTAATASVVAIDPGDLGPSVPFRSAPLRAFSREIAEHHREFLHNGEVHYRGAVTNYHFGCRDVECEALRPVCHWQTGDEGGPYDEVYWFGWEHGRAELVGLGLVELPTAGGSGGGGSSPSSGF